MIDSIKELGIKRVVKLLIIWGLSSLTDWFIKKFYPEFYEGREDK